MQASSWVPFVIRLLSRVEGKEFEVYEIHYRWTIESPSLPLKLSTYEPATTSISSHPRPTRTPRNIHKPPIYLTPRIKTLRLALSTTTTSPPPTAPITKMLTTHILTLLAGPFLLLALAAPVALPEPNDVLVPKGATLNARSIPELLALKRANEKRRLGNMEMAGEFRRGEEKE